MQILPLWVKFYKKHKIQGKEIFVIKIVGTGEGNPNV